MEFEIVVPSKNLAVKLEKDANDIDIVVTDLNGDEHVVAYLSDDGLHICNIDADAHGIDTENGQIVIINED